MNENRRPPVLYGQYPCNLPFKSLKELLKRLDQTMRWEEWLCAGKQLFPGVSLDDYQFDIFFLCIEYQQYECDLRSSCGDYGSIYLVKLIKPYPAFHLGICGIIRPLCH